jgi:hypothetical protein
MMKSLARFPFALTVVTVMLGQGLSAEPRSTVDLNSLGASVVELLGDDVREAIKKSLPFIRSEGVGWIEEQDCVSCHQVPAMLWSLNQAAQLGLTGESLEVDKWTRWSLGKMKELENDPEKSPPVDTMIQLILGRAGLGDELYGESGFSEFPKLIIEQQQPDGFWKAGGQLPSQKRPAKETNEVTTAWAVIALKAWESSDASVAENRAKAVKWLEQSKSGESTEWHVVRLLLQAQEDGSVEHRIENLLRLRNPDGGWSWIPGETSDAFATGQSLYALNAIGYQGDGEVVLNAIRFLVESQTEEGYWLVPGTKIKRRHRPSPTSNYWGTAWAVAGLSRWLTNEP